MNTKQIENLRVLQQEMQPSSRLPFSFSVVSDGLRSVLYDQQNNKSFSCTKMEDLSTVPRLRLVPISDAKFVIN